MEMQKFGIEAIVVEVRDRVEAGAGGKREGPGGGGGGTRYGWRE